MKEPQFKLPCGCVETNVRIIRMCDEHRKEQNELHDRWMSEYREAHQEQAS